MNPLLRVSIGCLFVAGCALAYLLLSGCAGSYSGEVIRHDQYMLEATDSEPFSAHMVRVGDIEIKIYIREHMPLCGGVRAIGCTCPDGSINIVGVKTAEGFLVPWGVLGHEIAHLMHRGDGQIINPDKYGGL